MSHCRIDNPCYEPAPFQSFTPVSPDPLTLPALAMSPCLWNRLPFPVCLCVQCALVNLESRGFLLLKDHGVCNSCLNVKAEPHTRWLCCLHMLYNVTKSVDWQIMALQDTIRETQSVINVWCQLNWTNRDETVLFLWVQRQLPKCFCLSNIHCCRLNYSPEMESTTPSVYSPTALNTTVN